VAGKPAKLTFNSFAKDKGGEITLPCPAFILRIMSSEVDFVKPVPFN
jgi:hypothetical protein